MIKMARAELYETFKTIGLTSTTYRQAVHAAQVAAPPARYRNWITLYDGAGDGVGGDDKKSQEIFLTAEEPSTA